MHAVLLNRFRVKTFSTNIRGPMDIQHGEDEAIITSHQVVLDKSDKLRPKRYVRKTPKHKSMLEAVLINPPKLAKNENSLHKIRIVSAQSH
jgi:hypothetical protein